MGYGGELAGGSGICHAAVQDSILAERGAYEVHRGNTEVKEGRGLWG
jgi:hypothetical protein